MENKLIEIKDLEIGDEILISCQSCFKYLKVLAKPKLSKTKVHWSTKQPLHGNVTCSTKQDVVTKTYTGYNNVTHSYQKKEWIVESEDHNKILSQNLSERQIWLVKRKKI